MQKQLRALIVEDCEDDLLLLLRHLMEGGCQVHWCRVDTMEGLVDALDREEWDIVFGDYSMPKFSGALALDVVKQCKRDIPFIYVSGTIGEDAAVAAMHSGAKDYIMKGNLKRLLPAVERELRESKLRQTQRRSEEELHLLQTISQATTAASDVHGALAITLRKVCETIGWPLAQAWIPRTDGTFLECSPAWYGHGGDLERFRTVSLNMVCKPGEDLPGRAWSLKQALWIENLLLDTNFPRVLVASEIGLKAALVFPVIVDDEVLAVLEFLLERPCAEGKNLLNLISAVAIQLGNVIQRKRSEERLHYLAHYDALTGLPNRVLFADRLKQTLLEAKRHGRMVGIAFLDLDRFKPINDSLGHQVGDLLLKAVAERLVCCVRINDTVARQSGDEFTLILSDIGHIDHAARVVQKILNSFKQPFHINGHELFTTASLGITLYPQDNGDVEGLLRNADIAMYRAKKWSGNSYEFHSEEMTIKAKERLDTENSLRRAIEHEELLLHYQPIVELRNGTLIGIEALVRWLHPQRGLIFPDEFIPVAEEIGLIGHIGEWVLHVACQQYKTYQQKGVPPPWLAINVSTRQFSHTNLVKNIVSALDKANFDPQLLELEITESLLMQNPEIAVSLMRELGQLGIRFSVDDFGTGYSSLAYLKHLPIHWLKIDKSFVRDIPDNLNDVAIISAIISLASSLGIHVIAEGVETKKQLGCLQALGCDAAQGYYFSQPLPGNEIATRLKIGSPLPWA